MQFLMWEMVILTFLKQINQCILFIRDCFMYSYLVSMALYLFTSLHVDVSKNRWKTPKWMVNIMENPIKMDDLGCFTPIFGLTPM